MKTISWKANLPCLNCKKESLDYRFSFDVEKEEFKKVKILTRCIKCGFPRTNQPNKLDSDEVLRKLFFGFDIEIPEILQPADIEIKPTYFRDCN